MPLLLRASSPVCALLVLAGSLSTSGCYYVPAGGSSLGGVVEGDADSDGSVDEASADEDGQQTGGDASGDSAPSDDGTNSDDVSGSDDGGSGTGSNDGADSGGDSGSGADGSDDGSGSNNESPDPGSTDDDEGSGGGAGDTSSGDSDSSGSVSDPTVQNVPPFVNDCGGQNDDINSLAGLVAVDFQTYSGVQLCANEEDWYEIIIPAGMWVSVELDIDGTGHNGTDMTDLDLVEADGAAAPIWWSASEQGYERLAWHNPGSVAISKTLFVYGYNGATADYDIVIRVSEWDDGLDCDVYYPGTSPASETGPCNRIMQFPQAESADQGYYVEHQAHYSNLRREVAYLVRYATAAVEDTFPGTNPLSLMDMGESDGSTPGAMVGQLRHPEGTHVYGNDIDIAYYQTGPDNQGRAVCDNDGY
ncbi:MAG: hypothetical protein CL928_04490, partial [Deltaproteobacteria bacterium]|nr:hypothetical protein [Deltaproteobacteria bacterium]